MSWCSPNMDAVASLPQASAVEDETMVSVHEDHSMAKKISERPLVVSISGGASEEKICSGESTAKLHVKVEEGSASGDSGPRSIGGRERCRGCGVREEPRRNELCDGCKQEGSGNFEGKVTRSSTRRRMGVQPVTPRLEEQRAVRPNRGMKRRFPGDESEDDGDKRKRARVRSISKVCGSNGQQQSGSETSSRGKDASDKDWKPSVRGRRRGRQSRPSGEIFICNVEGCEKSFVDAVALYNHGRVHGDRPYVCHYDGCTKRFSERSKLKRHFLIHTGEKPFICSYEGCGKAFSLDFNLRSHMKTHTGEYHECPHAGCEKRYCQEYKLRAHICKEHKGVVGKSSSEQGARQGKEDSVISSNDKAAKKKERSDQLDLRRMKLEKCKEGKKKRILQLESELESETKELAKLDKALRKVAREQELEELEGSVEQESLSSDNAELGEVYGEEKEVVMFAHNLPTADQGTRLVSQVVLIQGPTSPLSPSISSSPQPFLMSRMTSASTSSLHSVPGSHLYPYAPLSTMDGIFAQQSKEAQTGEAHLNGQGTTSSQNIGGGDPNGGVSQAYSANCQSSISFIHGEQSSQCEPPVSQLFTYHEQPCLQD